MLFKKKRRTADTDVTEEAGQAQAGEEETFGEAAAHLQDAAEAAPAASEEGAQSAPQASITLVRSNFSLNLPYRRRDSPMKRAKRPGPARSPTVLETPSADSVKAEAHWAIVASDAPEQTISIIISQNSGSPSRSRTRMLSPSSTSRSIGQLTKLKALQSGISAKRIVRIFQCSMPTSAKKRVEPTITPSAPQQ